VNVRRERGRTGDRTLRSDDILRDADNFSLVLGGPLYQLMRRARLSDDALHMMHRRVIVSVLLLWAPLFLLSAWQGQLLGNAAVPFLHDLEAQARFLLVVPLLILSELVVHQRLRPIARSFLDRSLIPAEMQDRYDEAINAAFRLRNSVWAEVLMLALVYGVGVLVLWRAFVALDAATWYASPSVDGYRLTPAGFWFCYISLPLFQFLLVRWYFRIFVWGRFLWHVSRIPLALVPTHPDRVGGLGFLSLTVFAFAPLAVAHGVLVAGPVANRIFFLGAKLTDFKGEIALVVVFLMVLVFGPLLVFTRQLVQAKRNGLHDYGDLAERYVRAFDAKWVRGGAPADEALVGSADIQSLADLANSVEVVQTMKPAPITRAAVLQLGAAILAPIVPLLLTMMPLEELLRKLAGLLF
jgi:hypothetical protein